MASVTFVEDDVSYLDPYQGQNFEFPSLSSGGKEIKTWLDWKTVTVA